MWKESVNKIFKKDMENRLFAVWFLWMAVYYGFRMFFLTPWYDELYTYYYFISRGPVYAAIHWPLPNNHVGYSVVSGFLNLLGSPVLGLRGVSYIAALTNLVLLYRIGRRCFSKGWSFCCVLLYSCMNLVNQLAVQGRGYTLAATCFLTAVLMLQKIGWKEEKETRKDIKYYVIFSLALTYGLYILPSSVYWVIPLCLTGGLFLLFYKKKKELIHLIVSSIAAALHTLLLYAVIWLAIGSNLLSKQEGGAFYGQGHIGIICSAPFQAVKAGIDYMLATPYIQSVDREGYLAELAGWFRLLYEQYYPRTGVILMTVTVAGIVFAMVRVRKEYREGSKGMFFLLLLILAQLLLMPLMLIVQCKLPYFRVFSYIGIPVAALLCVLLQFLAGKRKKESNPAFFPGKAVHFSFCNILTAVCVMLAMMFLLSKEYNGEYGMTEYYVRDALDKASVRDSQNVCVTDCYQQYLLKFYYDIECENRLIEEADALLLHREMTKPQDGDFRWEFYHTYETIPWDEVESSMVPVYENEEYIVYKRK